MENLDIRKEYIIKLTAQFFTLDVADDKILNYHNDLSLNKFLEDSASLLLLAQQSSLDITFMLEVPGNMDSSFDKLLVFFKIKPISITSENYLDNIRVTSLQGSPIKELYYKIHRIFGPLFLKDGMSRVDFHIPRLLKDLETNLHKSLFREKLKPNETSVPDILTIEDEIIYWENLKSTKSSKTEDVTNLMSMLVKLYTLMSEMDQKSYTDVVDILENAINILDDVWKLEDVQFPQKHMENIMDIIGNDVVKRLQQRLSKFMFWEYPSDFVGPLYDSINICEKWITLCSTFTELYWSHTALRAWTNGPFIPTNMKLFLKRLHEIQHMFLIHDQITSLFDGQELINSNTELCYCNFEGINPLYFNCYTEPQWQLALSKFYDSVEQIEEKLAIRLRDILVIENTSILQLLLNIQRYFELLKRPKVRQNLLGELQNIMVQVDYFITALKRRLDDRSENGELSSNIAGLSKAQHLEKLIKEIKDFAPHIFLDLNCYPEFLASITDTLKELKEYEEVQFQSWTQKAMSIMSQKKFLKQTQGVVVQFEQGKLMHVNFSAELLALVKETRQLFLLGYPVNSEILEAAARAKQFMSQAKALNQVASFHNTIGDRMINSQRSMMLNSARELAKLVQTQNTVTWENCKLVDDYIKKLQTVVKNIACQNNKLIHYHTRVIDKIQTLMDVDIIKQGQTWRSTINDIKNIVTEVEEQFSNTNPWKTHIDHQIYKVLEHHYQICLLKVNELMPDYHIELCYRDNQVTYVPNINTLRRTYYKKLATYIALPQNMIKPIGEIHIYPAIIEFNHALFPQIYTQAEIHFHELEKFKEIWYKWLALSQENIDSLMEKINSPEDWSKNFKASKYFGQQVARLPSLKQIGCFMINLDNLRSTIESQNRRYWSGLTIWLRTSLKKDIVTIQNFLDKAYSMIDQPPLCVEDISESHFNHRLLSEENVEISKLINDVDVKNQLLRTWTKETVPDVPHIMSLWDNFQIVMSNFHIVVSRQEESLKDRLSSTAEEMVTEIERFVLRWNELKPNEDKLSEIPINDHYIVDSLDLINNSRQQWEAILKKISKLRDDFTKLNMTFPQFDMNDALQTELNNCYDLWGLLVEFNQGLEAISNEDWIVIRSKAFQKTDNYLDNWVEKLKDIPKSAITVKILMTINQYKEFLPNLKYLRGETFTENHWLEVLTLLELPYKPIQDIKYSDFLHAAENVVKKSDSLKELNSRAASEVVIRNALSELDAWEVEAQFSTSEFTDSQGNTCYFLTDIKNILNKPQSASDGVGKQRKLQRKLQLNSRAASEVVIRNALSELDAWEVEAQFSTSEFTGSQGNTCYFLTDIKNILNKPQSASDGVGKQRKLQRKLQLNSRAASEVVIRNALSELDAWEVEAQFSTSEFTGSQGNTCYFLTDIKNILNKVGDNQYMLQSIKGTTNFSQFSDRVNIWEERLTNLDICLRDLNRVQRKWAYLEPIFGTGTLENSRFSRIDKEWRNILTQIKKNNYRVVPITRIVNITNTLQQLVRNLNQCQNTLQTFLEEKRLRFPRFYFINDEDLLEILGQSNKQNIIQSHLKKIFAGVHTVDFEDDKITVINSSQGEAVPLRTPVEVSASVEEWLDNLSLEIKETLKAQLHEYLASPDPIQYPSQIICLAERITFTSRCEKAIANNSLSKFRDQLDEQHTEYTKQLMEWSEENSSTRNILLHLKLKALLMDTIYHINLLDELIISNVSSVDDWAWQKRLRFYTDKDGQVVVKIVDAVFAYSYEYQGNAPKLVHTKLTDKCYLTLCQAMSMGFGGNPYGPAGTGKTESVKALGSLLGRQVLVFNCDKGLDVKSLTRIMVGLVKCGAWGCFDEFNRLEETTLSLISSQIHIIQEGLRTRSNSIVLLEKQVTMDHNAGIFITLNPAGKGYGGRQKLPENLKQLFRPVLMTKPDDKDIAKVVLHCEGFKAAEEIGFKLVTLFNMAKKVLAQNHHYDWGLRALKTVVGSCGQSLMKYLTANKEASRDVEMELAVEAVRLNTLPKLTFNDRIRFEGLIQDVFPGTEFTTSAYESLKDMLISTATEMGILANERQARKCIEFYEQLRQRMGVVIVGPSGCGKSTVISLLKNTLMKLGSTIRHDTVNPKSMTKSQLLGFIDADTRQWTNGVLTSIAQSVYSEPQDVECWIHCDGDIDPEWIESLNSVLDDNHLLTLPSGWRIQFGDNVHFIFETDRLIHASPATISRMGIIFMSEEDLTVDTLIQAWLNLQQEDSDAYHHGKDYLPKVVQWVASHGPFVVQASLTAIVSTCLKLLKDVQSKSHFCVLLINGFGSYLSSSSKEDFIKMVTELTNEVLLSSKSLYLHYDSERDTISEYSKSSDYLESHPSLVLTPEFKVAADVIGKFLTNDEPLMLVGPRGSGKRNLLKYCFSNIQNLDVEPIECSALLSPAHIMEKLIQVCVIVTNSSGRIYRPRNAENLIIQFLDINVIESDKWGSKMLIEFLRQITVYRGFYDSNSEWIGIKNVNFVYSVTSIEGLPLRFLSINRIYCSRPPNPSDLIDVYGIMTLKLLPTVTNFAPTIATIISNVCTQIQTLFNCLPHGYKFSGRDASLWCQNLSRHTIPDIESLVEVLIFEAKIIFRYKLIKVEEQNKFDNILKKEILDNLTVTKNIEDLTGTYYNCDKNGITTPFGNTLTANNPKEWMKQTQKAMTEIANDSGSSNLLMFPELLECISFLNCILTEPAGGALLAGRAGAGRKTAVQIVSHMINSTIFSPKLGDTYSTDNFKNDLKTVIQQAGINNEHMILLLEDYQILNAEFLYMINNLVASGEVLGLYHTEELYNLIHPLKAIMMEQNYEGTLIKYFMERVRRNIHLVLIFDHDNMSFFEQLRKYPAIFRNCYLMWLPSFSDKTMKLIPQTFLQSLGEENGKHFELVDKFNLIHLDALSIANVTPLSYFNFIKLYISIFKEKEEAISQRKERLQAGVAKITEAHDIVTKLKVDASEQKALLDEKKKASQEVLDKLSATMANANLHKNELEEVQIKIEEEKKILQARKIEIDKELAEIEPLMEEARAAVGDIKPEALSEIRSLRAPPKVIRDILEGVLRLMGIQDTSWNSMKTFLSKRGVKEDIKYFDASQITEENRISVEQLLQKQKDSFDSRTAKRASVAAAPLAAWVKANVQYSVVLQKIKPLETEQHKLERNLEVTSAQMTQLGTDLQSVDTVVASLKNELGQCTKEATAIELHLAEAHNTIQAAAELVDKLYNEYNIWLKQMSELSSTWEDLPKNCILSAAFITYLSSVSEQRRQTALDKWQKFVDHSHFSLTNFLSSDRELLHWTSEGLPNDELSRENGIITVYTKIPPLIFDPSSIAITWLKEHFKNDNVEIVTEHNPKFYNVLEMAVRFGKTLIVEDMQTLNPVLMPVLKQNFIYQGPRITVHIGHKLVDYNSDFKIFLATRDMGLIRLYKMRSPFPTINYDSTEEGLTQQLLGIALKVEKPKLEERRVELLNEEEKLKSKLHFLQEKVLIELANSQGDILQNKELLSSLKETKESSEAIAKSLEESYTIKKDLSKEYVKYQPLAEYGATLFFACSTLSKLNNMYHLSVSTFIKLYQKSMSSSQINDTITMKFQNLLQLTYNYISRSLFKSDRLAFALHLVHDTKLDLFQRNEWEVFQGFSTEDSGNDENLNNESFPKWIDKEKLPQLLILRSQTKSLYEKLKLDEEILWKNFMNASLPSSPEHCDLTEFQLVLVVQVLRPDRLHSALVNFTLEALGLQFLMPTTSQLTELYPETSSSEPILIITSAGTDPSKEIITMANAKNKEIKELVVGPGQESEILKYLTEASKKGAWVLLKNLHLITSWLPVLEKNLQNLLPHHEDFRLWLTSEPHKNFSLILLSSCMKITYEAPPGIKRNLERTYAEWSGNNKLERSVHGSRAMFVLAWIHATLQERRTYIPQGWTSFYEFNDTDLMVATVMLKKILSKGEILSTSWEYLYGLYEVAVYGGRINNVYDLRVLSSYLRTFFTPEVIILNSRPIVSNIKAPQTSDITAHLDVIKRLPNNDKPDYFGLPKNVNRIWERVASSITIEQLKILNNALAIDQSGGMKKYAQVMVPLFKIWKKLNQGVGLIYASSPDTTEGQCPIASFFSLELSFVVSLVSMIHKDLANISKALKTGSFMTQDVENIANALLYQKIPDEWEKVWSEQKSPKFYLESIMAKAIRVQLLYKEWKNVENEPIDLAHLFNVDKFLTALRQQAARYTKTQIGNLNLNVIWGSTEGCLSKGSVVIPGLQLEGAILKNGALQSTSENSPTSFFTDHLVLIWKPKEEVSEETYQIAIPLYATAERVHSVGELPMSCSYNERHHWIQTGTAFYISL